MSVERHLVNDALAYSPLRGNNTGVCSLTVTCFGIAYTKAHAIYLVFADLVFSGVKSLSRIDVSIYYSYHTHIYTIRCYFVCTHNRIRSPRLAAFGRIEIRWVREVGKFGPYLRYKDWLRRWTAVLQLFIVVRTVLSFENWHGLGESDCLIKT